jgi:hypothetical protein
MQGGKDFIGGYRVIF